MDNQTEKNLVEGVLRKLIEQGLLDKGAEKKAAKAAVESTGTEEPLTLEPLETIGVDNPNNPEALKVMRKSTPARVLMGRCGARPRTQSYLNFQADHAAAMDAVFMDVSDKCLEENGLFKVQTVVQDKDEFLMKPDLGKKLSEEAKKTVLEKCEKGKQVQIIVVDGLSSTAIEANISDVVPSLMQGLKAEGLSVGTPFFVKYGRVGVQDEIGALLECDVVVEFIGERPGLITAESMSAYLVYKAGEKTVEADRTILSNIHRGGTPPAEAGAHLSTIVRKMIDNKASGVALSEKLK